MISMKAVRLWFMPGKIVRAFDRAKRAVLQRGAEAVRDYARESMPRRRGVSSPGRPPRMRSSWLRRSVHRAWDRQSETAVAGPFRVRGTGAAEERNLMRVLEFGGDYTLGKKAMKRRHIRRDRKVTVKIPPKPYMGPALKRVSPSLPRMWAGSVRGG